MVTNNKKTHENALKREKKLSLGSFDPRQKWAIVTDKGDLVTTCRTKECCKGLLIHYTKLYYCKLKVIPYNENE